MPNYGAMDLLTDPADSVYGASPKIPLLKRPAAYRGYGVNNFNKRIDFKYEYLSPLSFTNKLTPSKFAGGTKGNLDISNPFSKDKMVGAGIKMPGGSSKSGGSGVPYEAILGGVSSGVQSIMSAYNDPSRTSADKRAAASAGAANAAADTLMSIPTPWTMAIGAGMKATDIIGKPLLNHTMSKTLKDFSKNINKDVLESSGFTGIAESTKSLDKDIKDYQKHGFYGKMAYGGTSDMILSYMDPGMAIAKSSIFGSKKLDAMKRKAKKNLEMQAKASEILGKSKAAKEASLTGAADFSQRNIQQKYAPDMLQSVRFGRSGMKISKLQLGGKMNVIVNGKLHKERHRMEDKLDFGDNEITKKGVPVVSMEDGGEIIQHSEVEKDEMILTRELTKKLEELEKIGDSDAMIEAGKILSYEIVKNTKDSKSKIIKNA